jgi:hypothetical protein
MGLSGVVAFLFVIEPSAHLTDPGPALCRVSRACPPALAPPMILAHFIGDAGS